jgi:hypothetical protein
LCAPEETKVTEAKAAVSEAEGQQARAKQRIQSAGKALIKIARDILGVDAALDCISSGDVGACGETLLNIAGSFAGGLAGKIMAKYGAPWKWAKGLKLVKRVTGLVKDLIGGAKGLFKANKALGKARMGLAKATEKLAEARKKAAAALKKKGNDSCPVPGLKHSFLPGTKVLLANGKNKPIEQVKLGDKITATDPKTGKTTAHEVVGTIVTEDDKHFVDLTIKGKSGKPETLVSTTTHPFWADSKKAWIDAGDLKPGMRLHTAENGSVELTGIRAFDKRQRTHDLTVSDVHTYYVLAEDTPLLVHNCGSAVEAVLEEAENVADLTNSQRPKVIEALQIGDQKPLIAHSDGGVGTRAVHPQVQAVLDSIPDTARGNNHGGCGLVECLTQALNAGQDPTGATAAAALGRARTNSRFKDTIGPCDSCKVLVEHFSIDFLT